MGVDLDCFLSRLKMRKTQGKLRALTRGRGGGVRVEMSLLETESLHAGTVFAVLGFSKLNVTLTSYGKREFVPRDQVSSLLVVYSSLFLHIILVVSGNFFHTNCLELFLSAYFLF